VKFYQNGPYELINEHLRGQRPSLFSDYAAHIPHLDAAIARSTINQDLTLYRGVRGFEGFKATDLVGSTFHDQAFFSTSARKRISEKFVGGLGSEGDVLFSIQIPKGSKGLAVHKVKTGSSFSGEGKQSEHEVLLPRGTSVTVKSVRRRKDGTYIAKAVLNQ
jgi:hypothetical protein